MGACAGTQLTLQGADLGILLITFQPRVLFTACCAVSTVQCCVAGATLLSWFYVPGGEPLLRARGYSSHLYTWLHVFRRLVALKCVPQPHPVTRCQRLGSL